MIPGITQKNYGTLFPVRSFKRCMSASFLVFVIVFEVGFYNGNHNDNMMIIVGIVIIILTIVEVMVVTTTIIIE